MITADLIEFEFEIILIGITDCNISIAI
jgi:hypothetical protein